MYAFVHIEKSAGTTLNHILRKNFFPNYIDVRPLKPECGRVFRVSDLRVYKRINPALKCISGHSIVPSGELDRSGYDIKYFTVLRDPVQRYVSQFRYLVKINRIKDDFEAFLSNPEFNNFQTRKIAFNEDFETARAILKQKMVEVGVVEEFDAFLLRLKKTVEPMNFDPQYIKKNITGRDDAKVRLIETYQDDIISRNKVDIMLYDHVVQQVIPQRNKWYSEEKLRKDLELFELGNQTANTHLKNYADYALRKFYYEPVTGLIRRKSGMPAKGSY